MLGFADKDGATKSPLMRISQILELVTLSILRDFR